jgi:cyclopropane-fatty-acyl-phospholipid synthase
LDESLLFSGGIMPSDQLLARFQDDLVLSKRWRWNGNHYQKTCEAWLKNMDANREEILELFAQTYGRSEANRWFNRWRMFYLACSELFGYDHGNQWWVAHYLFENQSAENESNESLRNGWNWSTIDAES